MKLCEATLVMAALIASAGCGGGKGAGDGGGGVDGGPGPVAADAPPATTTTSATATATSTPTATGTVTATATATATPTGTGTSTVTPTATTTGTGTTTPTTTATATATPTGTSTGTATATATGTPTGTATVTGTGTATATDNGVVLVEPQASLSASYSDMAIDASGTIHAVLLGSDSKLRYLTCAADCGSPSAWTSALIDPGVHVDYPLIRVNAAGHPRIAFTNFVSGEAGDYVGFCEGGCTTAAAWSWLHFTPPATVSRSGSHYFSLVGETMILGYACTSPLGALVCTAGCTNTANWKEVLFSDSVCTGPQVAVSSSGAMVYACQTADYNKTPSQSVEVWSCPGNCAAQASWAGVKDLVTGDGLSIDAAITVAANLGPQAVTTESYGLGILGCAGTCGQVANWSAFMLPGPSLYAHQVGVDVDEAGRVAIAFDGTADGQNGLFAAACATGCDQAGSWGMGLFDDAKRMATSIPLNPPSGCTNAFWMADRVNRVVFTGGLLGVTSGYGAIGTGGSCFNNLFSPTSSYTYMRSVVSFAFSAL
jgi:hypothetical protein